MHGSAIYKLWKVLGTTVQCHPWALVASGSLSACLDTACALLCRSDAGVFTGWRLAAKAMTFISHTFTSPAYQYKVQVVTLRPQVCCFGSLYFFWVSFWHLFWLSWSLALPQRRQCFHWEAPRSKGDDIHLSYFHQPGVPGAGGQSTAPGATLSLLLLFYWLICLGISSLFRLILFSFSPVSLEPLGWP
jgi:hypothetical protein